MSRSPGAVKQLVTSSRTGQRAVASHALKHLITRNLGRRGGDSSFINYPLISGSSAPVRSIPSGWRRSAFHVA